MGCRHPQDGQGRLDSTGAAKTRKLDRDDGLLLLRALASPIPHAAMHSWMRRRDEGLHSCPRLEASWLLERWSPTIVFAPKRPNRIHPPLVFV